VSIFNGILFAVELDVRRIAKRKTGRPLDCATTKPISGRKVTMAKYGKKASEKVEKAMHERKKGTLKSGSGRKVTSKKQAIAIGLSEARKAGGKVPKKKSASKKKKSSSKKK
jgi:uncharacterized protein DUF6496